jgi:signal transduction histidine kinase
VSFARILLIDDSPVVLASVAELLESRGYEVVTAERAETGLEILLTGQFTVVVTDVRMPGMDGLEMLAAIRSRAPLLPVIMLSSATDAKIVIRAIHDGAFDYVDKEDGLEDLGPAVRRAVDHANLLEENQRLLDQLRVVNQSLEEKVNGRTAELTAANERLKREMEQRTHMELELRQAQKLESIGRLASGIAHEINTPVQFVNDSCTFLREGTGELQRLVERYRELLAGVAAGSLSVEQALAEAERAEDDCDFAYLTENLPGAADRSLEGLGRVAAIVRGMKEFGYPNQKEKALVDLRDAVRTTLMIARNEYKYLAVARTEFAEVPRIPCYAGELNQTILNLVVNAAHAIEDVVKGTEQKGEIVVRTWSSPPWVMLSVEDTGTGIPPAILDKIFDPFFTTKEVGRGTGQGLAIARSVVVEKHGGKLTVDTAVGRGTTFTIWLPMDGTRPLEDAGAPLRAATPPEP